jgi:hypothetical protein
LVDPEDLHDGHAVGDGYRYRMIYVAPEVFDQAGRDNSASPRALLIRVISPNGFEQRLA